MMPPGAEKERRLVYALRMLAEETSQARPPAELEARLLLAMRKPKARGPARWVWVLATAAAVVLLMVVPGTPDRPAAPAVAIEDMTATVTASLEESDADAVTPWYVDGTLPAAESGSVVRMQVSRAEAAEYGAGVPDTEETTVEAEMFVGDDGLARAIRFVR